MRGHVVKREKKKKNTHTHTRHGFVSIGCVYLSLAVSFPPTFLPLDPSLLPLPLQLSCYDLVEFIIVQIIVIGSCRDLTSI